MTDAAKRAEIKRYLNRFTWGHVLSITKESPVFGSIKRDGMSRPHFHNCGRERYRIASLFKTSLEATIRRCEQDGFHVVAAVVQKNLIDELGESNDPTYGGSAPESHERARIKCYAAIGLTPESLRTGASSTLTGSALALGVAQTLVTWGTTLELIGALLALELFVAHEFKMLRESLFQAFAENFLDADGDDDATLEQKRQARLYIDDHIWHDLQRHYPALLEAVVDLILEDESRLLQIESGIMMLIMSRQHFYTGLGKQFGIIEVADDIL